jgi:hypothetical protein
MALFHELIKQKSRMGRNEFWDSVHGPYSQINGIDKKCLKPASLRMIQLGIIKKQMQTNARLKEANDFIQNLPMYNMSDTETMAANAIFSRIATILNSPFQSGDAATRETSDRVGELNRLLQTVNVNIPIPNTVIQALSQNAILTKGSGLYAYRAEKSKLFEEIAAAYFSGSGLGAGITTGSWGKISDNNRQLVTDVYAFLHKDGVPSMKGKYTSYEKTGYWKADMSRAANGLGVSVSSDLNTFIQEMEVLNGQANIGIGIDDELADTLDTVSSLRVQVKSGINQSILNANYRNAIRLSEFADSKLDLLMNLYYQDQKQSFLYFYKNPKDSETLTAYANYLLSTNIAKTSLTQSNDIYFTEHGFETVYDWMKNRNVYLRFQHNIKMNAQLLEQNRRYGFNAI